MASWAASQVPVTFVAFDLLHLDGQDLTGLRLGAGKRLLDELRLVARPGSPTAGTKATATRCSRSAPSSGTKAWLPSG
jgi:ATP-dependent DNA ligase